MRFNAIFAVLIIVIRGAVIFCFNFRIRELQSVDAINVTTSKESWLTLNVSEALHHWVNNPDGNRGLYLSVHPADRSGKRLFFSIFTQKSRSIYPRR